jgi:hypothetical protein
MAPHIRIADGLRTQTAEQLINTAGAIIKGLTVNPSFPSPPVDLKTVQDAVDDLYTMARSCCSCNTIYRSVFPVESDRGTEKPAKAARPKTGGGG